jgi:hypothetical protein
MKTSSEPLRVRHALSRTALGAELVGLTMLALAGCGGIAPRGQHHGASTAGPSYAPLGASFSSPGTGPGTPFGYLPPVENR